LGLFLLIGFITVKGSGMRGKSSVIRVWQISASAANRAKA
jgi:hypothetical protein